MWKHPYRAGRWPATLVVAVTGLLLLAGGCSDGDGAATTPAEESAATFCEVHQRFADELNMALANLDADAAQHTVILDIFDELGPVIEELRAAEPPELAGVVDDWVAQVEHFAAAGELSEEARGRMEAWAAENC
jgi:hypothetical protein